MDGAATSPRPTELIRSFFDGAKGDVSFAEIVAETGVPSDNARRVLSRLFNEGLIRKPNHGRYASVRLHAK